MGYGINHTIKNLNDAFKLFSKMDQKVGFFWGGIFIDLIHRLNPKNVQWSNKFTKYWFLATAKRFPNSSISESLLMFALGFSLCGLAVAVLLQMT